MVGSLRPGLSPIWKYAISFHDFSNLLALNAHYAGSYQHYGYWDGEMDPNTGLIVNSLLFGTSVRFGDGYVAQFNLIQPLGQKMLSKDSDTFKNGLTFLSTFSFPFMI